jgi:hypothetical protein
MYIKAYWSNWKSLCKAIVAFKEEESAKKALEDLTANNMMVDGKKVSIEIKGSQLIIADLKPITDEIFLD